MEKKTKFINIILKRNINIHIKIWETSIKCLVRHMNSDHNHWMNKALYVTKLGRWMYNGVVV